MIFKDLQIGARFKFVNDPQGWIYEKVDDHMASRNMKDFSVFESTEVYLASVFGTEESEKTGWELLRQEKN